MDLSKQQKLMEEQVKLFEQERIHNLVKEGELKTKQERDKIKDKRMSYKQVLDQQLKDNKNYKERSAMTNQEIAINKCDLDTFLRGDDKLNTMIPGI